MDLQGQRWNMFTSFEKCSHGAFEDKASLGSIPLAVGEKNISPFGQSPCSLWRGTWLLAPVFFLGNPADRGARWAAVHGPSQSRIQQATLQLQAQSLVTDAGSAAGLLCWPWPHRTVRTADRGPTHLPLVPASAWPGDSWCA